MYRAEQSDDGSAKIYGDDGSVIVTFDLIDYQSLQRVLGQLQKGGGKWLIKGKQPGGVYRVQSPYAPFTITCKTLSEAATLRFHLNRKV